MKITVERSKEINAELRALFQGKLDIVLNDFPIELREDFDDFLNGKTLYKKDDKIMVHYIDFYNYYAS